MLAILRLMTRALEQALALPPRLASLFLVNIAFNPRLGALRHIASAAMVFVLAAFMLVYVFAPIRGLVGLSYLSEQLTYDAERWVATAIYDGRGDFVGTFDPRLDSVGDFNFTDEPIALDGYVANPDHKSIPVLHVPDHYWNCLVHHEDRYLHTWRNPFGIDIVGVLKIPLSTVSRTIATGRPSLGVGGSTLPMQFVRVIYKTPPNTRETPWEKLGRKFQEWWLAPVIYFALTANGDDLPLKQWAANHLWLAQRTAGAPLHGVEVTSRVVFGKEAKDLTRAEQYVLASAVNKPIILLPGSERLNQVRLDRWRHIAEVRAKACAVALVKDPEELKRVLLELVQMAGGPPDPKVRPRLQAALETFAPSMAKRAEANPRLRANVLLPSVRFGVREEMKQLYGFDWRAHVRGIKTTLDAAENLAFGDALKRRLRELDRTWSPRLKPGFTLDPTKARADATMPDVVVVAANRDGHIVRYFENTETAPYFGSISARSPITGRYDPAAEGRAIASTGKILAAIAIANEGSDALSTGYLDTDAPPQGLETCRKGGGQRRLRTAEITFACSLSGPLESRSARLGQRPFARLVDAFGLTLPAEPEGVDPTPLSTASVRGLLTASPQRLHAISHTILASLAGRGGEAVTLPTLVEAYDFRSPESEAVFDTTTRLEIVPDRLISRSQRDRLRAFLSAPLCARAGATNVGTLSSLANWCAARRSDLNLHFAKTGTRVNLDPDETVDVWTTGGLQFSNGAAYSYVVLVGTGTPNRPFGRSLHASQIAAPLVDELLRDLARHALANPLRLAVAIPAREQVGSAAGLVSHASATSSDAAAEAGPANENGARKRPASSTFTADEFFRRSTER